MVSWGDGWCLLIMNRMRASEVKEVALHHRVCKEVHSCGNVTSSRKWNPLQQLEPLSANSCFSPASHAWCHLCKELWLQINMWQIKQKKCGEYSWCFQCLSSYYFMWHIQTQRSSQQATKTEVWFNFVTEIYMYYCTVECT